MISTCVVANWNVEWVTPRGRRFAAVSDHLCRLNADILCVTEGQLSVLPPGGFCITSTADYGYQSPNPNRRKVLLWSRNPWREVDTLGSPDLPGGRFVSGVTETPIGPVKILGVCIPWRDAHVRTGRKDRLPWQDHTGYLSGLRQLLANCDAHTAVVGDFNQRIPRKRSPKPVFDELMRTFDGWQIVTAGDLTGTNRPAIDHIALNAGLTATTVRAWPRAAPDGRRMSDHDGVVAEVTVDNGIG